MHFFKSVVIFFKEGGFFLWPLVIIFVVGVAIAVERWFYLTRETMKNRSLWDDVAPHLGAGNFKQAIALANGSTAHRLPNTTNVGFPRLEAEAILLLLSERGVCASAGAACSSGSLEPSHVLRAMGIDDKLAHGAIRFSLSRYTTDAEVDRALAVLPGVIDRLRAVLPV